MKAKLITIALGLAASVGVPLSAVAQIPASITTPDKVEASIGTLEYKDGAPSKDTGVVSGLHILQPGHDLHARLR